VNQDSALNVLYPWTGVRSQLQALEARPYKNILAFIGYEHSLAFQTPCSVGAPRAPRNAAFLLCRRLNRIACEWFNERSHIGKAEFLDEQSISVL
jgi:hypothetical protein